MTTIEITTDKETYLPGEEITGKLTITPTEPFTLRDIILAFYGSESTEITRSHYNPATKTTQTTYYDEEAEITSDSRSIADIVSTQEGLPSGQSQFTVEKPHQIPFSFKLPEDALPTYDGECADVSYSIHAKIDIPRKSDVSAEIPIEVLTKGNTAEEDSSPEPLSDNDVRVKLDKRTYRRGETIEGTVEMTNNAGKTVRGIELKLYSNEHAEAEDEEEDTTMHEYKMDAPIEETSSSYVTARFQFTIPEDVDPTIRGTYFSHEWCLEAKVDIKNAKDMHTSVDISID
jgi:hypothetical protein